MWLLFAAEGADPSVNNLVGAVSAEQVFGGVILVALLWLIMAGKIRIEREVLREKEINSIHEETIQKQRETIKALTSKDRETLYLLRQLRTAAVNRGDLKFSEFIEDQIGSDHE